MTFRALVGNHIVSISHKLYRVSRCYVKGRVDTSGHFFIVSNHNCFTMSFFARVWGDFWHVKKSLFCEKCIFVFFNINGPNLRDFYVSMDICAVTHEHPGTRRCIIHQRTLTTTLIPNTTKHANSLHIWINIATVRFVFGHGRADFERISCSERAPKRRRCRLKRRSFLWERRRPTRLQRCPGRSTCMWKVVIRTLEL